MEKEELEKLKREELLELARKQNIKRRSKMKKAELIKALLKIFGRRKAEPKVKEPKRIFPRREKPQEVPSLALEKELVESTKFRAGEEVLAKEEIKPQPQKVTAPVIEEVEIPHRYGEDRLTLMVRDPWWIYAYWEITPQTWEAVRARVGVHVPLKEILRVYDVTDIPEFRPESAQNFFDIELTPFADNWYINVGQPDRSYCAGIGLRTPEGNFYTIVSSNVVRTPRYGICHITDEEWMISEEDYWKMFGLSGGYGIGKGSLEMQELFKKRFEELISSGFPGSVFSWMPREEVARGFWLIADAELIVYGATENNAKVTVQGKPIKLREDGTFSLRFALPDGRQEIPIIAYSNDGVDRKEIKLTVSRETVKEE